MKINKNQIKFKIVTNHKITLKWLDKILFHRRAYPKIQRKITRVRKKQKKNLRKINLKNKRINKKCHKKN